MVSSRHEKPEVLNLLHHQPGVLVQPVKIFIQADDVAGILGELNITGSRHAHRLLGVLSHLLGVDVDRAAVRSEDLVLEAADSRAPLLARLVQNAARLLRIEQDGPRVPSILHGQ